MRKVSAFLLVAILVLTVGSSIWAFTPRRGGCGTPGYWKNHDWPVSSITLGTMQYSAADAMAILKSPIRGDIRMSIAHHLIAAKLNVAGGASPISAISAADAYLTTYGGLTGDKPRGADKSAADQSGGQQLC